MVKEENVKLMTKIAIYEKKDGKTQIPMHEYYKDDYVRLNCLKAVVSATIVFAVVFILVIFYKMDYLLINALRLDYKQLGLVIGVAYIVWVLLYWLLARILYAKRYEDSRSNIIMYNHQLKKLQEEADKKVVKTKGGVIRDDFIEF